MVEVSSAGKAAGTRARRVAVAVAALVALVILAGLPVYVFPPADPVVASDVAYVIGPPTEQRVALAEQLQAQGLVDEILVSVPRSGGQSAREQSVCAEDAVTCETPDPSTTKGEVAMLQEFARAHSAQRVIVVTFSPHVARTRFIFDTCFDGDVRVLAADQPLQLHEWAYQYAYQSVAFVKAALTPCAD